MTTQAQKSKRLGVIDRDIERVNRIIGKHQQGIDAAQQRKAKLLAKQDWLEQMPVDETAENTDGA